MDKELEEDIVSEYEDIISEDDDKIQGEHSIEEEYDIQAEANNAIVEPKLGIVFDDPDTLYNFWMTYGTTKGFPVRKRSSYKTKNGIKHFVVYMCSLGGKSESPSKNPNKLQAHVPQVYTGEHGIPHCMNMNYAYVPNAPTGYVPNVPAGFLPNAYVQPTGYGPSAYGYNAPTRYGPSVYVRPLGYDPSMTLSSSKQQHAPAAGATICTNNNTRQ